MFLLWKPGHVAFFGRSLPNILHNYSLDCSPTGLVYGQNEFLDNIHGVGWMLDGADQVGPGYWVYSRREGGVNLIPQEDSHEQA